MFLSKIKKVNFEGKKFKRLSGGTKKHLFYISARISQKVILIVKNIAQFENSHFVDQIGICHY